MADTSWRVLLIIWNKWMNHKGELMCHFKYVELKMNHCVPDSSWTSFVRQTIISQLSFSNFVRIYQNTNYTAASYSQKDNNYSKHNNLPAQWHNTSLTTNDNMTVPLAQTVALIKFIYFFICIRRERIVVWFTLGDYRHKQPLILNHLDLKDIAFLRFHWLIKKAVEWQCIELRLRQH